MSRSTVYIIGKNGDTGFESVDVPNGNGSAPVIWDALCQKHLKVPTWMDRVATRVGDDPLTQLDKKLRAGELPEDDAMLLLFTFDRTWVKREHVPFLADILDRFWAWNSVFVSGGYGDRKVYEISPTIPGIIKVLRDVANREDVLGVCFQMTSVSENVWWIHTKDESGEWDDGRAFNVLTDTFEGGDKPEELGEVCLHLLDLRRRAA